MTKWMHKCDLNWLKARQNCLTATDVKELLPVTKTGRKRTITDENYLKVLASKLVHLSESDCVSTGAAARGHILEPYAIDLYNEEIAKGNVGLLWHWDDMVITRPNHVDYGLAFSPDATNMRQPPVVNGLFGKNIIAANVNTIGEVKSYSPERHIICGHTPKEELEERWQIATAMAVCPTIEKGYLLFYNPSMVNQLYIVEYDNTDLIDEIEMVLDVERNWLTWVLSNLNYLDLHYMVSKTHYAEQHIIDEIMKREELNPDGEKSVMR